MNNFIKVNSKMNMSYYIHQDVLVDTIKKIFLFLENTQLVDDVNLQIEKPKNNISYLIKYKIRKNSDFVFETKNLLFLIEQKIFSLLNTKPTNITLKFCGEF
ncbi:MMB_0454 family protein [Mycoplasma zalophi]|uniref:Uncharacterized protein n=1 Tax=Mycoplasma zalophi TaxID=191287 RepID=A0ABS6DPT7_9MOLU|nr:hypothetical protein [Mycoplasma zalophi]MBU4690867.1 hypothetical protein [Mycoplasma zalophi]MBU4692340.1 hypothetical protein [Mycoplasma zalophi]